MHTYTIKPINSEHIPLNIIQEHSMAMIESIAAWGKSVNATSIDITNSIPSGAGMLFDAVIDGILIPMAIVDYNS